MEKQISKTEIDIFMKPLKMDEKLDQNINASYYILLLSRKNKSYGSL